MWYFVFLQTRGSQSQLAGLSSELTSGLQEFCPGLCACMRMDLYHMDGTVVLCSN